MRIVYSFGANLFGQCGIDKKYRRIGKPTVIETFKNDEIEIIKCGSVHSYVKTKRNKHFLFGQNRFNQCTLTQTPINISTRKFCGPFCINQKVKQLTNGQEIINIQ